MRIHRITFAALILGIGIASFGAAAMYRPEPADLWLRSGYAHDATIAGIDARSIVFSLERTSEGWSGWMSLDPNEQKFSDFGDLTETTLMAGERIDVTLTRVGTDEGTGRTCYLVGQNRFDRTMYLVFPNHLGGTYRLVVRGNGPVGTHIVLLSPEETNDQLIASTAHR